MHYPATQLFDLVADVETYPAFIEWFVAVRILHRAENRLDVEQIVRYKGLHARFVTCATLERPKRITIVSHDPPFETFQQNWAFQPAGLHRTTVDYETKVALHSAFLERAMEALFNEARIARETVDAFERRARQIYGGEQC
jgi:coenzyme Q-binding protein COQ10